MCIHESVGGIVYLTGECDWEATKKLYREMLLVFDRLILPTHASCHVQFILFYLCSTKTVSTSGSNLTQYTLILAAQVLHNTHSFLGC